MENKIFLHLNKKGFDTEVKELSIEDLLDITSITKKEFSEFIQSYSESPSIREQVNLQFLKDIGSVELSTIQKSLKNQLEYKKNLGQIILQEDASRVQIFYSYLSKDGFPDKSVIIYKNP